MGARNMGLQARLMSQALRKLTGVISKSNCSLILSTSCATRSRDVRQPETTPGGRALKFLLVRAPGYPPYRADQAREEVVGGRVRVKVVKNKVACAIQASEFDLMYDEGVSAIGSILDEAEKLEITKQSGSWVLFGDENSDRAAKTRKPSCAKTRKS